MSLMILESRRKRGQRKHQGELDSRTNTVMLILTVLMYSLSTAHIALHLRQNLIAFFEQHAADGDLSILNDQGNPIVYAQIALEVINVSKGLDSCTSRVTDRMCCCTPSAFLGYVTTTPLDTSYPNRPF